MKKIILLWDNFDRLVKIGLVSLLVVVFIGTLVPIFLPNSPLEQNYEYMYMSPNRSLLLGGDQYGRDVFGRALIGTRYSLSIGLTSSILAGIIGTILGMASGYYGRLFDLIIQRVVDALMSVPIFMFGLMVVVALGTGYFNLLLAITFALAPRFARLARASTLEILDYEYIEAANALGASARRCIFRHILPNIVGPIFVQVALFTGTAIVIESGISFLGLGIQPPTPSWGNMIKQGIAVLSFSPWISLVPACFLSFTVLAVNILGDGLRNQFDPKALKKQAQAQTTER